MSWYLKEKLQQALDGEQGASVFAPGSRKDFALVYPNSYHVGMSNLGFHIIYQQINSRGDSACERVFLPDAKTKQEYIRTNTPLLTLETQRPLYEFPFIAFAVSFEMDYFNVLNILSLGKVTLLARERRENDPLIMIGGPCATFNPEPLAEIVDICIVGEGEEVIHEVLDAYYQGRQEGLSRENILLNLAHIEGVYVPRFYEYNYKDDGTIEEIKRIADVPAVIYRRFIKDLDKYPGQMVIVTNDTEFKDMFLIEIARGCGRHCRFCMAGYCFRRPRNRSLTHIKSAVAEGKKVRSKVGLVGAAISDYPEIDQLCELIIGQNMGMSVASLRADSLTPKLVESLASCGHKTITVAPEAASAKMRRIINKGITEEHLYTSIAMALRAGIPNVRLYFMIGLPFEEQEDIVAIVKMAQDIKKYMESLGSKGKLTLSINPFIPKPFTPFQWEPMESITVVEARLKTIHKELKSSKGLEVITESPKEAYIQAILARGDRRLTAALLVSYDGSGGKGFRKALKESGVDETFYLYRQRQIGEILPWNSFNMGFDPEYLVEELANARLEKFTPPCVEGCRRCGVCT